MSAQEIMEVKIPQRVKDNPEVAKSINGTVVFDLQGDGGGQWSLDLTNADGKIVSGANENAKVVLTMKATDFVDMVGGKLNPQMAFLGGKLKVKGDMGAALKLGKLIG